jgi:organic radical activating enzyme
MREVRTLHRQNVGSKECMECYKVEKVVGQSPRTGQNVNWILRKDQDQELSDFMQQISSEEIFEILDQMPVSLELRLGNQCNLKCVSCWGMSSSLIQTERVEIIEKGSLNNYNLQWLDKKWKEETEIVKQTNVTEWYETDIFYENFRKMAPKLRRLYTTGGEPTVIKANYRMLEMLLEAGNKTCSVEFTSNMTTWNPKFYDALSQFEEVEIQMSLDGVDDVAEFIRYGSDFSVVRENIFKAIELASKNPKWRIKTFTVLQALNYDKLVPLWELLYEAATKYNKRVDWWPIVLNNPEYLSLATVKLEDRMNYLPTALDNLQRFYDTTQSFCISEGTKSVYLDAIKNMPYNEDWHNKHNDYVKFLNDYRSTTQ